MGLPFLWGLELAVTMFLDSMGESVCRIKPVCLMVAAGGSGERQRERAMLRFLYPTFFDFQSEPSNYVSQPILFKTYATLTSVSVI